MIRKGSLVDDICCVLIDRIVSGAYMPGIKLSQDELAQDLAVSRTPLREALNRLQQMGLVVATVNRGMEVAPVSLEETEQWYAMRLLIEPPIVCALTNKLRKADFAAMSEALVRMRGAVDRSNDFQDAHHDFHNVMLAYYPLHIREMIESIYLKIIRHQRVYFSRPRVPDEFCETDFLFLRALEQRNGKVAKRILEFHLIDAALGLIMDAEPDHHPKNLVLTAAGLGIYLSAQSTSDASGWERPITMLLKRDALEDCDVPDLKTSNLVCLVNTK